MQKKLQIISGTGKLWNISQKELKGQTANPHTLAGPAGQWGACDRPVWPQHHKYWVQDWTRSCPWRAAEQMLLSSSHQVHLHSTSASTSPEAALGKTEAFPPCGLEPRWSSEFMRNGTPLKSSHNTDGAESSSSSSYCNCQEQVPFAGCCGKMWESSPVLRPSDVTSSEIEMKSKN